MKATWDNPIWFGNWRIYLTTDGFGPDYAFVHDDYDGAPDAEDSRFGFGSSIEDCQEQIKENWGDEK